MPDDTPIAVLEVKIDRVPFEDYFMLSVGSMTEELDPEETRDWFRQRVPTPKHMDEVEKILDYVWNFYHANITIKNPRTPQNSTSRLTPQL